MSDEIIATTKVFDRGKTTIPFEIRVGISISDGDKLVWKRNNLGRYFIEKAIKSGKGIRFTVPDPR